MFMKVKIMQQPEGKPGFVEEEETEIQINPSQITLFNKSEDPDYPNVTFVRLTCGASLVVCMKYNAFEKALKAALK